MTIKTVYVSVKYHTSASRPLPADVRGKLWIILHDFECSEENFSPYLPRVCEPDGSPKLLHGQPFGTPEVESLITFGWETTTREQQEMWFGMLKLKAPAYMDQPTLLRKWSDLIDGDKFITNKHGPDDGYADFINGINTNKPGFGQQNTTTCGNVVVKAGEPIQMAGKSVLPIYTIDRYAKPLPPEEMIEQRWLTHYATICRPERIGPPTAFAPNGIFRVDPFPHLDGNDVPFPIYSKNGDTATLNGVRCRINFISMKRVRPLPEVVTYEQIPSPYVR